MGGIAKLFGGGHTSTIEKADPAPTTVATSSEITADTNSNKKKKRRGFASTQTSTIASGDEGGRNTLG